MLLYSELILSTGTYPFEKLPNHYILSEVFCQDPIERYFSKQQHREGGNENPIVDQFHSNSAILVQQQQVGSVLKTMKVEQQNLAEILSKAHFFILQADGSTDCATIKKELYLCLFLILMPLMVECMCMICSLLLGSLKLQKLKVYMSVLVHFNTLELITGRVN